MGLFTGFSILSGIEILYFVAKLFLSMTKFQKRRSPSFLLSLCLMYQEISKAFLDAFVKWSVSDSLPLKWGQNDSLRGKDVSNIVGD